MKKFKFTMQTLLNVKVTLEKQKMGELSNCNARIRALEKQQEENYALQAQHTEEYTRILEQGLPLSEMLLWRVGFTALRDRIVMQAKQIEDAYEERTQIQEALVVLMQERKMLEKLREKQLEEYKALQRAEDTIAAQEFLSNQIH